MKKRVWALLLMCVMLASLVAGCGGGDAADVPDAGSGAAEEAAEETSEAADAVSDENVTIKYLQWQQEFQTAAISLADAYMEQHPNVTVEVVTDSNSYFENLKANLAAGEVPEIFVTEGYNNMKAYQEYITDLSDQPWVSQISEAAIPCITLDEKVMGMPITMAGEGIVYNKKMFADNGWEVPTTLSEFEALCQTIQAAGITPLNNQFADDWLLGQFISAAGYAYIPDVDDFTSKRYAGEITMAENEQMQKNLDILDILLEYGQDSPMANGWNETCSAFAMEECAMAFEGDWIWDTVYPINPEIECGMFAIPATDNADDTKMIVDANALWHVGKGSKHPEVAIDFLNWVATDEAAKEIMLKEFKVVPVFEGWEYSADNQLAESTIEYLEKGETYPWSWPTWPDGFRPAAGKAYQEYIEGTRDKQSTLEELDTLWDSMASATTA